MDTRLRPTWPAKSSSSSWPSAGRTRAGAGVALADVLLDSGAANGEEGELGGHQEGVDQHEAQHCEDA
jgi:hypothetical protein